MYSKVKSQLPYEEYDVFEKFERPKDMGIAEDVAEFERLPDGILAHKFFNNALVPGSNENLIRESLTDVTYETVKIQIMKIFGNSSLSVG